jgi:transposase
MSYTEAFKAQMVRRMMGPEAVTPTNLGKKVGVSQQTLSRWAKEAVTLATMDEKAQEKEVDGPPRRRWTAEEKLRVLVAAHGLDEGALGALLRREGLHGEELQRWREATAGALGAEGERRTEGEKRRAAASERRIRELEKELTRKEKALAEAAVLLMLEKKLQEMDWDGRHRDEDEKSPGRNEK